MPLRNLRPASRLVVTSTGGGVVRLLRFPRSADWSLPPGEVRARWRRLIRVVSLRRTPFGRPRSHRRTASAGFVAFSALLMVMMTASPAVAQPPAPAPPPPPTTAADAETQLEQAQRDAEALTEDWHNATDDLDAKRKEADDLKLAVDPAKF